MMSVKLFISAALLAMLVDAAPILTIVAASIESRSPTDTLHSPSDVLILKPGDTHNPRVQEWARDGHFMRDATAAKRFRQHLKDTGTMLQFKKANPELGNVLDLELAFKERPTPMLQKITGFLGSFKPWT